MNFSQMVKYIYPYVRPYRWILFIALMLTLIGSFIAQVNAYILRYTVDAVNNIIENQGGFRQGSKILLITGVVLLSKEIFSFIIQFGQKYYGEKLRISVSNDLNEDVINKLLSYRMIFFTLDKNRSGRLQSRIDRGVDSLTQLMHNFFIDILPLFITSLIALILLLHTNIYIGFVALLLMPLYYYINKRQAFRLEGVRRKIKNLKEEKSYGILEILRSILIIKSFNKQSEEKDRQMLLQTNLSATQIRTRKMRFLFEGSKSLVEQFGVVIIIVLSVYFILKGHATIGSIMFNVMLFNNVSAPIRQLHRVYDQMSDALIYSESFFDIINTNVSEKELSGNYKPLHISGHFQLKNVMFSYPESLKRTLNDISIDILPNKTTALVGLSGAGKSTLINLLAKFYIPDSGEILLDGISIQDYDTVLLRNHIGLVLQENHIFDASIYDNIRYGNTSASDDEIIDASRKAYLHDQIMLLPSSYDTSALKLSGGQQQKIAIARVFLKNPPIIFLDEPTSNLDAISTEEIKKSLDAIKKDRTVVIISHSLPQIIDSDVIYVLENGSVVQRGAHDDIYNQDGVYKKLFDAMVRGLNIDKIQLIQESNH